MAKLLATDEAAERMACGRLPALLLLRVLQALELRRRILCEHCG
ncbi:MAG: hypothetical protein ACYC8S_03590 [Minisyncoccota bacterium]